MRDFGINVPVGYPARTMEEAIEVAKKIGRISITESPHYSKLIAFFYE